VGVGVRMFHNLTIVQLLPEHTGAFLFQVLSSLHSSFNEPSFSCASFLHSYFSSTPGNQGGVFDVNSFRLVEFMREQVSVIKNTSRYPSSRRFGGRCKFVTSACPSLTSTRRLSFPSREIFGLPVYCNPKICGSNPSKGNLIFLCFLYVCSNIETTLALHFIVL
jgi:hypothetical protein